MVALDLQDRRHARRAALERLFGPLPLTVTLRPSSASDDGRSLADPATGRRTLSARAYPASFAAVQAARQRLVALPRAHV